MMRRFARRPLSVPRALVLSVLASILLLTGLTPVQPAAPASASTAQTMAADLLSWINSARVKHGLGTLRADSRLASIASQRAAKLASLNVLSHTAAGCLSCQLAAGGVSYNLVGEVLASNNFPWGPESASVVFSSWRNSPTHWDILMGSRMDSIGIGVSRSSNGTTYASAVLIDAPGITATKPTTHSTSVKRTHALAPPAAAPPAAPEPRYIHR